MSTSIYYKPLGLKFSPITHETVLICRPEIRKVKRALFEPVDHAATQKFIEEELDKITVLESEKWNFDFKREKTLNPDGNYKWRPVTPQKTIRPIKMRPTDEPDIQELYGEPLEITRPTPVRADDEIDMKSPPKKQHQKPQRLITDFMSVKKRSTSDFPKKSDWTSPMERPAKLPRLTDSS